MSVSTDLLKARHIGIRHLKEHVSTKFLSGILVITDRGTPISVNLPYLDLLELVDILDELGDTETVETVSEGRKSIRMGTKGIYASKLFNKIRARRK